MVEEDIEITTFDGETITKSEYRDNIINMYVQAAYEGLTKITDFTVGSEAYHLADIIASLMLEHRENIDNNYRMSMIHYAAGEFLDNFGDIAGVHRIPAAPSTGEVVFTLKDTRRQDTVIPAGTIVSTEDAVSFLLDDDVTIMAGDTEGSGEVLCEQDGEYTNVLPNTVTIIVTDLGITGLSVTNPEIMAGGEDVEDDDVFRNRILNAPYNVPCGTLRWYENVILSDDACNMTVHDVRVMKDIVAEADVTIYFKPIEEDDYVERSDIKPDGDHMVPHAEADLYDLFKQQSYDLVGITVGLEEAEKVTVLPNETTEEGDTIEYLYAIVYESSEERTFDDIKDDIEAVVTDFNVDSEISVEFTPDLLASAIEEVEDVLRCRIIRHNKTTGDYGEFTEQITMNDNEYYAVDVEDISNRIREVDFTIDI